MKKTLIVSISIIALIVIVGILIYNSPKAKERRAARASFASCIKDSGAIFYGAFWCPHCQNQKKLFKESAKLLPYFECSTPDGQSMLSVCQEAGIKGYPTWMYSNGTTSSGEQTFSEISAATSCPLPPVLEK